VLLWFTRAGTTARSWSKTFVSSADVLFAASQRQLTTARSSPPPRPATAARSTRCCGATTTAGGGCAGGSPATMPTPRTRCRRGWSSCARNIRRFDGRSAFTTWSYRVVSNACLDELRRRARRPRLAGWGPGGPATAPSRPAARTSCRTGASRGARRSIPASRAWPTGWRSTPRWPSSPTSSGWRSSCATCVTWTTPRSPRSSTSRPAPSGPASPGAADNSPTLLGNPATEPDRPTTSP
jgi:hypothetical protein